MHQSPRMYQCVQCPNLANNLKDMELHVQGHIDKQKDGKVREINVDSCKSCLSWLA